MKQGKTLVQLAEEIQRQAATKKDYIVKPEALSFDSSNALSLNGQSYPLTQHAHRQLGTHLEIPAKYYDKMLVDAPELLQTSVNTWFAKSKDARMVRTLDGKARALLSDRYRPYENIDLAEAVLPVLGRLGVEILSCDVTEKNLYIKCVDKKILKDIPTGKTLGNGHTFFDTLSPGIVISNSEVGSGALSVEASIFTHMCTNLAVTKALGVKKYHVGVQSIFDDTLAEYLSDSTKRLSDQATWARIRDVVEGSFNKLQFEAAAAKLAGLVQDKIEGDPVKVIELAKNKFSLSESEGSSILKHLITGGDLTRYGFFNAVTRTAEDLPDYDRATDFERLGGKIIELPKSDWAQLATAA